MTKKRKIEDQENHIEPHAFGQFVQRSIFRGISVATTTTTTSSKSDVKPLAQRVTFKTVFAVDDVRANGDGGRTNFPHDDILSPILYRQRSRPYKPPRRSSHKSVAKCNDVCSYENHLYPSKERAELQHAGVALNPYANNAGGQHCDNEGNLCVRFCYDTGRIGTVIPNEVVKSDPGPIEPLVEGAREFSEFSVASGESVLFMGKHSCRFEVSMANRLQSKQALAPSVSLLLPPPL